MKKIYFLLFLFSLLASISLHAQENILIKGSVLDKETGERLVGVSIVLDGKPPKSLTNTNANGDFTAKVPVNSTLILKYLGYRDFRQVVTAGQTNFTIKLASSAREMNEVVIRGYVARQKEETTGSSVSISGKEIRDIPAASAEDLLQGKVAGLNIQVNTGAPGFRGSVSIRGVSTLSISGSGENAFLSPTSPLYIIDGVPIDADGSTEYGYNSNSGISPLSMIPPEDIQTIEVLKDAQATSLYGSRGAYGVIIITTRKGNSKAPRIRYDTKFFLTDVPKLKETLGGQAERQARLNQIRKFGSEYGGFPESVINTLPALSDSLNPYFNNSTNWQGVFNKSTFNQTHNLGIDGGDDTFNYKTNLKWYNEKGIIANTGQDVYSLNMNMAYKPSKKFNVFFNVLTGLGKRNAGGGNGIFQNGVAENSNASSLLPGPSLFQSTTAVQSVFSIKNDNATKNLRANGEFSFMPIEGLRFTSTGSYEYIRNTEDTFTPSSASIIAGQNWSKLLSYFDRRAILYNRNAINFSKTINYDHSFNILLFNEISKRSFQANYMLNVGTANDYIWGPLGSSTMYSRGGGTLDNYVNVNTAAFSAFFSYNYKKKYILDLSYRLDGSSVSGFDDPYSKNPTIGLRWNYNKEKIFENANWLSSGSIRATWGRNVSPTGDIYTLYGTYSPSGNYVGSPSIGNDFGYVPNNTLKPTTNTTYNLAFDFGFLQDRFTLTYETYLKTVSNLLWDLELPTTAGFIKVKSDDASVVNYGHEANLNIRPLSAKSKVNLAFNINAALNRDVITQLPGGVTQVLQGEGTIASRVGRNAFSNYTIVTDGVYSTNADVPVDPITGLPYRNGNSAFFQEGDPRWVDVNGDYILDDNDKQITGNLQPRLTGGLNTTIGYKGFSLLLTGVFTVKRTINNRVLADRLKSAGDIYGSRALLPIDELNYWKNPGDVAKFANPYDYIRYSRISPFRENQSLFLEDGSYFKLNTATFGYTFKKDFVKRLNVNSVRLYLSAYNIFTASPYSGSNPETVTPLGYDKSGGYPVARKYSIGFNIEL